MLDAQEFGYHQQSWISFDLLDPDLIFAKTGAGSDHNNRIRNSGGGFLPDIITLGLMPRRWDIINRVGFVSFKSSNFRLPEYYLTIIYEKVAIT